MRKKIVAGNWKMNKNQPETRDLLEALKSRIKQAKAEVIVAPPFTNLALAVEMLKDSPIQVAAQNLHFEPKGAYTGEISADMLLSLGVKTVIIGHSERRSYFHETDAILSKKADAALKNDMTIIFCFGEELKDRKEGRHFDVVSAQIKNGLFHLESSAWPQIILAYEPVWAIGTGETATTEQAQEMHAFIRKTLLQKYDATLAQSIRILYGGSVKADNAGKLFSQPDIDGGLIGGAALNAQDFTQIVESA